MMRGGEVGPCRNQGGGSVIESALSSVIGSGLPAAMTFLFQRLDHLLSSRRSDPNPQVPAVLVGRLDLPLEADTERWERHRPTLEVLSDALSDYRDGRMPVESGDERLLRMLGRLRGALEDVYGQHLTFEGEDRPLSGPFVRQDLGRVAGEAVGMDVAEEISGSAAVTQRATHVDSGAKLIGMRARRIGPPTPPAL